MKTGAHEVIVYDPKVRNLFGYARVSRQDQNLDGQLDALRKAGVGRVYAERVSSVGSRTGWAMLVKNLRPGDVVVVTRLDRIGRRLAEVVATVQHLVDEGVHLRAIGQSIDTSAPGGSIMMAIWAALAETERQLLRERTREGLAAAKARGKKAGRPIVLDRAKLELVAHLRAKGYSHSEIGKTVKAGATTVRRALADMEGPEPKQLKLGGALEQLDGVIGVLDALDDAAALRGPEDAQRRFRSKAAACMKANGGKHPFREVGPGKGDMHCDGCGLDVYAAHVPSEQAKKAIRREKRAKKT